MILSSCCMYEVVVCVRHHFRRVHHGHGAVISSSDICYWSCAVHLLLWSSLRVLYCTVCELHTYESLIHYRCVVMRLAVARTRVYVWRHTLHVAAAHVPLRLSGHDFHSQTRPSSRTHTCCSTTHFTLMCEQCSLRHHGLQSSSLRVVNNMQVDCVVSSLRSVSCQVVEIL